MRDGQAGNGKDQRGQATLEPDSIMDGFDFLEGVNRINEESRRDAVGPGLIRRSTRNMDKPMILAGGPDENKKVTTTRASMQAGGKDAKTFFA